MRKVLLLAIIATSACEPAPESPNDAESSVSRPNSSEPSLSSSDERTGSSDPVTACVERGINYFKEIGSYPTLSSPPNSGRPAEEVALERCQRTTTAF